MSSTSDAAALGANRGKANNRMVNALANVDGLGPEEKAVELKLANDELEFGKSAERAMDKANKFGD
jgi:hypothetical protein